MSKLNILLFLCLLVSAGYSQNTSKSPEVIYHVFQRSFYDSNGDSHGDLKGLQEKLGDLQELGVTALQLLPLYPSIFYHNYFATDFKNIDPKFGTTQDLLDLIKEVHKRGMKIYLDMETQYVTEDHLWFHDSNINPASKYTNYLIYNGPGNTQPETIIFNLTELSGYNGAKTKVTTVNLIDKNVLQYNIDLFHYFMDPDLNGNFDDGVDGFRLDHMMDDLDWKHKFTGLFEKFWSPLLTNLKSINPKITIVAEQADWGSWGTEFFSKGKVDRVFAFRLAGGIASFDKKILSASADSTYLMTPPNGNQVVFIENHDTPRFASTVNSDPLKLRVGAALNLLIGKIPAIYYGQELGMTGTGGFGKFGNTDGNDIPRREAYEWYTTVEGKGMALWYRNTGPWWDQTNLKPGDGISLEEQNMDPNSLWNFYKTLISIRKSHPALAGGNFKTLQNGNEKVFSFLRREGSDRVMVVVNLSDQLQSASIAMTGDIKLGKIIRLLGKGSQISFSDKLNVTLPAYGVEVLEIR